MNGFYMRIEAKDGELESIMKELNEAQKKIYECYNKLQDFGILTIRKTPSDKTDGAIPENDNQ